MDADVIVIGAGIVGCATAYYLAKEGGRVLVVERGGIAAQQSSRAWGFLRQQGRHPGEIPLAREALAMWQGLEAELGAGFEYVRDGILLVAETEADEARFAEMKREAAGQGIGVELVARRGLDRFLPEPPAAWRGGLYSPGDGHAEPGLATRAFAAAAARLGVAFMTDTPVDAILVRGESVCGVRAGERTLRAPAVFCAAGLGSQDLLLPHGISLPVQAVRASVAQTGPAAPRTRVPVWTPRVAYRPKPDGSFYFSNGYRGVDAEHDLSLRSFRHLADFIPTFMRNWRTIRVSVGPELFDDLPWPGSARSLRNLWDEPRVNRRLVRRHARCLYEIFPDLEAAGIARAWAGRIDATPDLIPIIHQPAHVEGLLIATGFNGHGFALAPAVGRQAARILTGNPETVDLKPFRLGRFAETADRPSAAPL
ncbi:MAG: NAD(P)/FAD-dependent oxidoreductase [Flavobacteriaceae bacterium]